MIKIAEIKEEIGKSNWELLSTSYKNLDSELIFKCNEGHIITSTWRIMRKELVCPVCKKNKLISGDSAKIIPKKKKAIRVLGIDQATLTSGWSIYDNQELVAYGILRTSGNDIHKRISDLTNNVSNLISNWKPDCVAIEDIQLQYFVFNGRKGEMDIQTYKKLAHLQGALINLFITLNTEYEIVHQGTWRKHCKVTGRSRADKKKSMQLFVKKTFDKTVTDDEADAIGIGKYLAYMYRKQEPMEEWT